MGDADIFGLRAVDLVAENPAAGGAVGVHAPCGNIRICRRREMQEISTRSPGWKARHAGADGVDHADALVTEDAAGLAGRRRRL